jgi:cytochrome c oxidase subunit IV
MYQCHYFLFWMKSTTILLQEETILFEVDGVAFLFNCLFLDTKVCYSAFVNTSHYSFFVMASSFLIIYYYMKNRTSRLIIAYKVCFPPLIFGNL